MKVKTGAGREAAGGWCVWGGEGGGFAAQPQTSTAQTWHLSRGRLPHRDTSCIEGRRLARVLSVDLRHRGTGEQARRSSFPIRPDQIQRLSDT